MKHLTQPAAVIALLRPVDQVEAEMKSSIRLSVQLFGTFFTKISETAIESNPS